MARIPQPDEIARLKDAHKKDPQRYRKNIPKSDIPIGNAPDHLSEGAAACWFEIESLAIPDILTAADRIALEAFANLLDEYREDPRGFTSSKMKDYISFLARFGMTPSDRNKLAIPKPPEGGRLDNLDA